MRKRTISVKIGWRKTVSKIETDFMTLLEQMQRFEDQQSFIAELDKAILDSTDNPNTVFQKVLDRCVSDIPSVKYAHILQLNRNKLRMQACSAKDQHLIGMEIAEGGLVRRAITEDNIINSPDARKEKEYEKIHPDTRGELVIPIKDKSGMKLLGVLNIEKTKIGEFTIEDVDFCKLLAGQLALAIEQAKLWKGIQLISSFNSKLLSGEDNTKEIYKTTLSEILRLLDFEYGQIMRLSADKRKLRIMADSEHEENLHAILDDSNSISGHYLIKMQGTEMLSINNLKDHVFAPYYGGKGLGHKENLPGSMFLVPLISNDAVVGLINLEHSQKNAISSLDRRIMTVTSSMLADAIKSGSIRRDRKKRERSERQSFTLAQMGVLAVDHAHKMGGTIAGVIADINTFSARLIDSKMAIPSFGKRTGLEYLNDIKNQMQSIYNTIEQYREDFNPDRMKEEKRAINIITEIRDISTEYNAAHPNLVSIEVEDYRRIEENLVCELTPKFKEVIRSLIDNAIDAMANCEKKSIRIKMGYHGDLSRAKIIIEDSGHGIPAYLIENGKIFEYGFTTKNHRRSKNIGGQGIGMWFVQHYTEYFDGSIKIDSRYSPDPNHGTSIILSFPLY